MITRRTASALAMVAAMTASAGAQTAVKANVNVNVRTGPSTGYGIIGVVPANHIYAAQSSTGGWWKIWFDSRMGYTYGGLWTAVGGQYGARINTTAQNVRTGPSTGYGIVGQAYLGEVYHINTTSNGWYQICYGGTYRWIYAGLDVKVALSGGSAPAPTPPPPAAPPSDLAVIHYYQPNGVWCVRATCEMVIKYLTGVYYSQSYLDWWINTYLPSWSATKSTDTITHFTGQTYSWVWWDKNRLIYNINRYKPCPAPLNMIYIAYSGVRSNCYHSLVFKGYTSGGIIIHDPAWGPNKWASNTEVANSMWNYYNHFGVRY